MVIWFQLEEAKEILTIEYVSVIGLLLAVIVCLVYVIKEQRKEIKEKDEMIIGFIEKYYTLSTRIKDKLEL